MFGLFLAGSDTAILTAKSDDKGCFSFEDVPFGDYIIREIEAPTGYVLSDEMFEIVIAADGGIIEITAENKPIKGSVEITKTDISDGRLIPDCGIEILDSDGNIIFQGRTDENGVVKFENLRYGDYFYREFDAPDGYLIDENAYPFSIKENGEIVKSVLTNEKMPEVPEVPKIPDNPKTGVDNPLPILLTVASIALILSILLWTSTRRKEDSNENEA